MDNHLEAIELEGMIDKNRRLHLNQRLPIQGPKRVRVIVLFSAENADSEDEWLSAGVNNPAFADLDDPIEDIYSLQDGKPIS
jgi:hypothetical protein